jgi:hypothetical protein
VPHCKERSMTTLREKGRLPKRVVAYRTWRF